MHVRNLLQRKEWDDMGDWVRARAQQLGSQTEGKMAGAPPPQSYKIRNKMNFQMTSDFYFSKKKCILYSIYGLFKRFIIWSAKDWIDCNIQLALDFNDFYKFSECYVNIKTHYKSWIDTMNHVIFFSKIRLILSNQW